jgi:hypothetical protein
MNLQKMVVALAVMNVSLVALVAAQARPDAPSVVRAQAFELVDAEGVVRSRLWVKAADYVELQMFDRKGLVQVKFGGGDEGSGLWLADETRQSGVQIVARQGPMPERKTTSITLTRSPGQKMTISPQGEMAR